MRARFAFTSICLAAISFASCEVDWPESEPTPVAANELRAGIRTVNRTTISGKADGCYKVAWQASDDINVNGDNSLPLKEGGTNEAVFSFPYPLAETCNCLYPAAALISYSDGQGKLTLPAAQQYRAGSFDPAASIMLAKGSRKGSVAFSHAMAYMSIVPKYASDLVGIKSITITSMGEEMLAGTFSTDYETLSFDSDGSSSISVTCDESLPLGTTVILAIPAGEYPSGLMITIRESGGEGRMVQYSESFSATAGTIYDCPLPYVRDTWPEKLYLLGDALVNGGWTKPAVLTGSGNGKYTADAIELDFNENDDAHALGLKIFETDPTVSGVWVPQYGMTADASIDSLTLIKGADVKHIYPGRLGLESGTYKLCVDLQAMSISFAEPEEELPLPPTTLCDTLATRQTRALYANLKNFYAAGKTLFGVQMPTLFGIDNWQYWGGRNNSDTDHSDTKYLAGSHPAVCGWELAGIEKGNDRDVDGNYFSAVREHIKAAYGRGAVNTISWHCGNPATDGLYNDNSVTGVIERILPGGDLHDKFCLWMDRTAAFLASLTGPDGEAIPIIFRPWHEHTDRGHGSGFWWAVGNNSDESFTKLWKMTYEYMTITKGLHNLIWAYSPDLHHLCWDENWNNKYVYMWAWPGDAYVDILGLDAYETSTSNFDSRAGLVADYAISQADARGKIFAVTETGILNNSTQPYWWTNKLYGLVGGRKTAYVMVWRNDWNDYYYNAFRGCCSADDFLTFASKDDILLENELKNIYKQ